MINEPNKGYIDNEPNKVYIDNEPTKEYVDGETQTIYNEEYIYLTDIYLGNETDPYNEYAIRLN